MNTHPPIIIATDFGSKSYYTGIMKGVINKINPRTLTIDLINDIEQGNILQTDFLLKKNRKFFPDDSIFLVVVDPGVGTQRIPVIVKTDHQFFVGPNNGIFSFIQDHNFEIYKISKDKLPRVGNSNTFHGRDIFAPAAALLSRGANPDEIGIKLNSDTLSVIVPPAFNPNIDGQVIYCDSFGNAVTDIEANLHNFHKVRNFMVKNISISKISHTFGDAVPGEPLAYTGSLGTLEFAVRNGNFANKYKIKSGDFVQLISGDK